MDSLKNIFAVSDLRNRVLFTLGMLGGVPRRAASSRRRA